MNKEKLVLAYSGGLDTSVLVHWLAQKGYEVIALCLDLGQKVEDLDAILEKGKKAGAAKVLIENVEEEFEPKKTETIRDIRNEFKKFNKIFLH